MDKLDIHNSKERFNNWKLNKITGITKENAELLRDYVLEMESGLNTTGNVKGSRSYIRLNAMISRLKRLMELCEEHFKLRSILSLTEKQAHDLFTRMTQGKILKNNGEPYKAIEDYVKSIKAFWHWYIKRSKKEGIEIKDILTDLQAHRKVKPKFVYFTEAELEKMKEKADYETMVLMSFLFDTGIRSPTECFNIKVSDFSNDYKELTIRPETSKTFGRKIRLMHCSKIIKEYIEKNNYRDNDFIFPFNNATINKRLKKIGKLVLGDKVTLGREKGSNLTMYDFRHSSACYWLPRYKSRSALLYRMGWKEEREIFYYSELLGMHDTISEEDLLLSSTKTELELKIKNMEKDLSLALQAIKELQNLLNPTDIKNPKLIIRGHRG